MSEGFMGTENLLTEVERLREENIALGIEMRQWKHMAEEHSEDAAKVAQANARYWEAEVERLRTAGDGLAASVPDAQKLELLAQWLDLLDRKAPRTGNTGDEYPDEVQRELRRWAKACSAAVAAWEKAKRGDEQQR